eukprot:Nitzschia sp. Nitz4//scaffold21_size171442//159282//160355//NITZ4_002192-RA/size171442-processed-gene-0.32-mRNA-1//1//CDS//3329542504//3512//frame0
MFSKQLMHRALVYAAKIADAPTSKTCRAVVTRYLSTSETVSPTPASSKQFSPSINGDTSSDPNNMKMTNVDNDEYTSSSTASDNNTSSAAEGMADASLSIRLQDVRKPCAQHLDPTGKMLPTSEWIHINGTLPVCSLEQVLSAVDLLLHEELIRGVIDLEADWNPIQDPYVPTISPEMEDPLIEAAHVVISPFGRPNGWYVKLRNRSFANAILTRAQNEHLKVGWKAVQVSSHKYIPLSELQRTKGRRKKNVALLDPALANGLVVDDSMVRIENCPHDLTAEYVRYLLSRYDLAPHGDTVIPWKGQTNDGKVAPLMYVVRFASPEWARAAVRECQATIVNGKEVRLVQYPRQLRYEE